MATYIDASILVALIADEPTRPLFRVVLAPGRGPHLVSDFCLTEVSAALAALVRGWSGAQPALSADLKSLDDWVAEFGKVATVATADIHQANAYVRRLDLALRAPDAIHIAAARRLEATLVTLDRGQAAAARTLGVACINPAEEA